MSTGAVSEKNSAYFQAIVPGRAQKIAFTGVSAQSLAFKAETTLVCLFSTQDCYITTGTNPTAADPTGGKNDTIFLPGGLTKCIGVVPGEKLAVIRDSASGNLHLTEGK